MTDPTHALAIIIVCGIVTVLLRTLPFIIWNGSRKIPEFVLWLGHVLPCAIMMMLVVFALRNTGFQSGAEVNYAEWLPTLTGVGITAGTYVFKRNTLMSIVLGTVCYMVLLQLV